MVYARVVRPGKLHLYLFDLIVSYYHMEFKKLRIFDFIFSHWSFSILILQFFQMHPVPNTFIKIDAIYVKY